MHVNTDMNLVLRLEVHHHSFTQAHLEVLPHIVTIVPAVDGLTSILHKAGDCAKECQDGDGDKVVQLVNTIIITDLGTQSKVGEAVQCCVQPVASTTARTPLSNNIPVRVTTTVC